MPLAAAMIFSTSCSKSTLTGRCKNIHTRSPTSLSFNPVLIPRGEKVETSSGPTLTPVATEWSEERKVLSLAHKIVKTREGLLRGHRLCQKVFTQRNQLMSCAGSFQLHRSTVIKPTKNNNVMFKIDRGSQGSKCVNRQQDGSLSFVRSMHFQVAWSVPDRHFDLCHTQTLVLAAIAEGEDWALGVVDVPGP